MEYFLEILIPMSDFYKTDITEILVEWGGEVFSQEPQKYKFKSMVLMKSSNASIYYQKELGDKLNLSEYIVLHVDFECLQNLESIVNNVNDDFEDKINSNELIQLFYHLYKNLDSFCIVNNIADELIDDIYIISNACDAINIFLNSIKWTVQRSIALIKK